MKKLIIGLSLITSFSSLAATSFSCTADLSILKLGKVEIQIEKKNGKTYALVHGQMVNPDVKITTFEIRDNLNLLVDPYSEDYVDYNFGERALFGIYDQENGIEIPGEPSFNIPTDISFDLLAVKKVVVYDLSNNNDSLTDKFGGQIVFEAYDKKGQLLGRVASMMLTKGCH